MEVENLWELLNSYLNLQIYNVNIKRNIWVQNWFVSNQKEINPQSKIESKLKINNINFPFFEKLNHQNNQISIIGEIKKASPSLGKFTKENINLIDFAKAYEDNNISCISVLTDEKYFNGKIEDLIEIRKEVQLPILRKDFIVDDYQIYESKLIGADCILIILSMLSQDDADRFAELAYELKMDSIIEVHDYDELQRAKSMKSNMIGINNRNLNNFVTTLDTSINLSQHLDNCDKLIISESGFHSKSDISKIYTTTGISNYLIGEFLMKSDNLPKHIEELLN